MPLGKGARAAGETRQRRVSDYALQLREKQKLRFTYGVLEQQFRRYYEQAARRKGGTGKTCSRSWNRASTTSPIAWASGARAPRPGNWSA